MKISKLKSQLIGFFAITLLFTYSCGEKEKPVEPEKKPTPYDLVIPKGFPTNVNIPEDNPMTVEGVKLGRYLYYDGRLSGKADEGMPMSCSSCHLQQFSFENGVGKGTGTLGIQTHHVMLPHVNLLWKYLKLKK